MNKFYLDQKKITAFLNKFITSYQGKLKTINYTDEAKIKIRRNISENQEALKVLVNVYDCSYKEYNLKCHFLKNDYLKYLDRRKEYLNDVLDQINITSLFFKQNTTKNVMDYYNSRLFYNHKQIKIMRDDSKNFIEEFCKCKAPNKKR